LLLYGGLLKNEKNKFNNLKNSKEFSKILQVFSKMYTCVICLDEHANYQLCYLCFVCKYHISYITNYSIIALHAFKICLWFGYSILSKYRYKKYINDLAIFQYNNYV
jgi:hypothetical protein